MIIGYGNPGAKFVLSSRNAAYIVLDAAVFKAVNIFPGTMSREWTIKSKYMLIPTNPDPLTIIVKPRTYEDRFDDVAYALYSFYNIAPSNFYIVYPDSNLPLGEYEVGRNEGAAPENIRKIATRIGSHDYWKVRIGIKGAGEEFIDTERALMRHLGEKLADEIGIAPST